MRKSGTNAVHIASLLMQALSIPEGRSLVSVFGCGSEASNLEAITTWVESHMNEIDAEETILRLASMTAQRSSADDYQEGMYGNG